MLPLKIAIPSPCFEDWDKMATVDEKQRFCLVCTRSLTDFTTATDREIYEHVKQHNGKLCGRFRPDQLGRPLRMDVPRPSRWRGWLTAASILMGGSIAAQIGAEQVNITYESTRQTSDAPVLTGLVTDDDGEPLLGATVVVWQDSVFFAGTTVNEVGVFTIQVPTNARVEIRHLGYVTTNVAISDNWQVDDSHLDVVLQNDPAQIDPIIVVGYGVMGKVAITGAVAAISETRCFTLPDMTAAVDEPLSDLNFLKGATLYPNPSSTHFYVRIETPVLQTMTVTMYTPDGKLVHNWGKRTVGPGKQEVLFNYSKVGRLPAGHYFLYLRAVGEQEEVRVLIKQ